MHPVQHSAALVALVTEDDGDEAVGGDDDRRREAETIVVSRFTSVALLRAAGLISDAEETKIGGHRTCRMYTGRCTRSRHVVALYHLAGSRTRHPAI